MDKRIFLEQEHKTISRKIYLASMENNHIKHLIKLAQDPGLIDLMGWHPSFKIDDVEQFIQVISSYVLPYSRKNQPLVFGIYLDLEDFPIGYVVLKGLNQDLLTVEIGMAILDQKYRHKGYGSLRIKTNH